MSITKECKYKTINGVCAQSVTTTPNLNSPTVWAGRKIDKKGEVTSSGTPFHVERFYGDYCYYHQKVYDELID